MNIGFTHVPTGKSVRFKAFITAFNETYNSDWAQETVFGRGDPIYMFKNTTRTITLSWKIPAATTGEAFDNLGRLQKLLQFMYPTYTTVGNSAQANTINQSPLVRMKVMNLVQKNDNGHSFDDMFSGDQEQRSNREGIGLLGAIKNISVTHNLETDVGVFETYGPKDPQSHSGAKILPKLIEVNMDFAVLHEHTMGFDDSGFFGDTENVVGTFFPYGVLGSEYQFADHDYGQGLTLDQALYTRAADDARQETYARQMSEATVQNALAEYNSAMEMLAFAKTDTGGFASAMAQEMHQQYATRDAQAKVDRQREFLEESAEFELRGIDIADLIG
jgi:hypothetical protein